MSTFVKACQRAFDDPQRFRDGMRDSRVLQHAAPTPSDPAMLNEWDLEDEGLMLDSDHCGGCHEEGEIYTYRLDDGRKAQMCCCGAGVVEQRTGTFAAQSACPANGCIIDEEYHRVRMTYDWRLVGRPHRRRMVTRWA